MKYKTIIWTLALGGLSLFAGTAYSQDQHEMRKIEHTDSLEMISQKEVRAQKIKDDDRLANAKSDRKQTRMKAKEAQRVERDANDAARESRVSVRSERRAQKSRKQADKQEDKASRARDKSDNN